MSALKIGIIGLGKMGRALVKGLQRSGGQDFLIEATTSTKESAEAASRSLGINCHNDNHALVKAADLIVLCVKPYQSEKVVQEIASSIVPGKVLISVCAAVTIDMLRKWSGGKATVIRAMPNTPSLVGEGMTVLSAEADVTSEQIALAERVFSTVGKTAFVKESSMDGVTGLSGCGPAYVFLIIEALSEAGVKVGLPGKTATLLAAQTLLGSAKMVIESGEHPSVLRADVTTPAGCTIDGLIALEEGNLRASLIKAVLAAAKRSKELRG